MTRSSSSGIIEWFSAKQRNAVEKLPARIEHGEFITTIPQYRMIIRSPYQIVTTKRSISMYLSSEYFTVRNYRR